MSKKLLKFSQPSCSPCKMLKMYLHSKNIEYEEIDVFEDVESAMKYGIVGGLPILILLDGEKILGRSSGFNPGYTDEVDALIEQL